MGLFVQSYFQSFETLASRERKKKTTTTKTKNLKNIIFDRKG
jgi:hypothetical protein